MKAQTIIKFFPFYFLILAFVHNLGFIVFLDFSGKRYDEFFAGKNIKICINPNCGQNVGI